jgi:hypothetical protein
MRGESKHHDSDRQKKLRTQALRRSIGLAWERVPSWIPTWPQELAAQPVNVDERLAREQ